MKNIEIFLSLDLEMNQPSRKIIQIGACIGNISTEQIIDKLSIFINPNERLSEDIIKLTGITQKDVDNGVTLYEGYELLRKFHERYSAFINPITWGGGDSQELLDQLKVENSSEGIQWCFGRRWIDTKTLFVSWRFSRGEEIQGGLARSLGKVGLNFVGRKHNATDDAVNTFRMYCKMLKILKTGELSSIQSKQSNLSDKIKT